MNTDCAWFASRMEGYCCGTLTGAEQRLAEQHLANCRWCMSELDALNNLDSVVRQVFRHRLSLASAPRTTRVRLLPFAVGGSMAAAALLLVLNLPGNTPDPPPAGSAATAVLAPIETPTAGTGTPKSSPTEPAVQRAKPSDESPAPVQPRPELDAPAAAAAPDFAVIDAAGYSTNLDNYKGYYLVMGVWSGSQPETVEALNRIYTAFGDNQQVRVLGVASARQESLDRATFPVVFNKGSKLMGLKTGELVLIDRSGRPRWTGALNAPSEAILSRLKSEIETAR